MEVHGRRRDTDDEDENDDKFYKLCELCKSDNFNTPANGFCKECEEYMCTACFKQHIRAKSCRHHVSLDIHAYSETCLRGNASAIKCKLHNGETIKYYCQNHEVVGCGDCMVIGHNGCNSERINDLSDRFDQREEYKTLMRKLEKLKFERNDCEKEIYKSRKTNKLMHEMALKDIRKFRIEINEYLDKAEAGIIAEAYEIMEENEHVLTKLDYYCRRLSSELKMITEKLNRDLYKDNVLFIHTIECKRKVNVSEKDISEMKSVSVKAYRFLCDKQLRSLISSDGRLGTYAVCNKTTEMADNEEIRPTVAVGAGVHAKPSKILCNDCGEKLDVGTKFCKRCRRNVKRRNPIAEYSGYRTHFRVGARVKHNSADKRGTVKVIFGNGMASVQWDNGTFSAEITIDELSFI